MAATQTRKPYTATPEKLNFRVFERGNLVYEVYRLVDVDGRPDHLEDPDRYRGINKRERANYEAQDRERMEAFERGDWCLLGVVCDIRVKTATNWAIPHKVGSASLWGIESDSGEEYFVSVERDMVADAEEDLQRTREALEQTT